MMNRNYYLFRFSGKYWQYQLIGFTTIFIGDLILQIGSKQSSTGLFFKLLVSYAILFGLFTTIRIFYKKVYKEARNPLAYLIVSVVTSLVCSFLFIELRELARVIIFNVSNTWYLRSRNWAYLTSIIQNIWVPFAWSLLYFGIKYWQDSVIEGQRANEAQMMAQKAQLQMLRYQLNPHFLFNSLNSIQALVHENPDQADKMVSELSDFLRYSLKYNEKITIPVREEIEIAKRYLSIEKVRYEERLDYSIKTDSKILSKDIPCFITQPLFENAIVHGLRLSPAGIKLLFYGRCNHDTMTIEISNSGSLAKNWVAGFGITNVIERLENSYCGKYKFSLEDLDGFIVARIIIKLDHEKDNSSDN